MEVNQNRVEALKSALEILKPYTDGAVFVEDVVRIAEWLLEEEDKDAILPLMVTVNSKDFDKIRVTDPLEKYPENATNNDDQLRVGDRWITTSGSTVTIAAGDDQKPLVDEDGHVWVELHNGSTALVFQDSLWRKSPSYGGRNGLMMHYHNFM